MYGDIGIIMKSGEGASHIQANYPGGGGGGPETIA